MRSTLLIIALLVAGAAAASRWPAASDQSPTASLKWVRTADGWERSAYLIPAVAQGPRLHPLTVAALQVLGAGVALAAGWRTAPRAVDELGTPEAAPPARRRARTPVRKPSTAKAG